MHYQLLRTGCQMYFKNQRNIFTAAQIGIDSFLKKKKVIDFTASSDEGIKDRLKKKCLDEHSNITYQDLEQMCYLSNSDEDLDILEEILRRYNNKVSSDNHITFKAFNIGPEIARLYYHLDKPLRGLSILQDSTLTLLQNKVMSYVIIQSLLFKCKYYKEVCDVYHLAKRKQFNGRAISMVCFMSYQAACYKINTDESYSEVKEEFKKFIEGNSFASMGVKIYMLLFALARNDNSLVLQHVKNNCETSLTLKVNALANLGEFSKAFDLVNSKALQGTKFNRFILEDLDLKFRQTENEKDSRLLEKYKNFKNLLESSELLNETLDEVAEKEISKVKILNKKKMS